MSSLVVHETPEADDFGCFLIINITARDLATPRSCAARFHMRPYDGYRGSNTPTVDLK